MAATYLRFFSFAITAAATSNRTFKNYASILKTPTPTTKNNKKTKQVVKAQKRNISEIYYFAHNKEGIIDTFLGRPFFSVVQGTSSEDIEKNQTIADKCMKDAEENFENFRQALSAVFSSKRDNKLSVSMGVRANDCTFHLALKAQLISDLKTNSEVQKRIELQQLFVRYLGYARLLVNMDEMDNISKVVDASNKHNHPKAAELVVVKKSYISSVLNWLDGHRSGDQWVFDVLGSVKEGLFTEKMKESDLSEFTILGTGKGSIRNAIHNIVDAFVKCGRVRKDSKIPEECSGEVDVRGMWVPASEAVFVKKVKEVYKPSANEQKMIETMRMQQERLKRQMLARKLADEEELKTQQPTLRGITDQLTLGELQEQNSLQNTSQQQTMVQETQQPTLRGITDQLTLGELQQKTLDVSEVQKETEKKEKSAEESAADRSLNEPLVPNPNAPEEYIPYYKAFGSLMGFYLKSGITASPFAALAPMVFKGVLPGNLLYCPVDIPDPAKRRTFVHTAATKGVTNEEIAEACTGVFESPGMLAMQEGFLSVFDEEAKGNLSKIFYHNLAYIIHGDLTIDRRSFVTNMEVSGDMKIANWFKQLVLGGDLDDKVPADNRLVDEVIKTAAEGVAEVRLRSETILPFYMFDGGDNVRIPDVADLKLVDHQPEHLRLVRELPGIEDLIPNDFVFDPTHNFGGLSEEVVERLRPKVLELLKREAFKEWEMVDVTKYTTSSSTSPLQGFVGDAAIKVVVHSEAYLYEKTTKTTTVQTYYLPRSATCFYQIYFAPYPNKYILRRALIQATRLQGDYLFDGRRAGDMN